VRTGRDVAVLVRRGDELLLLRHARKGYWHVVAGVVENGETFGAAAARELHEETGLVAEVPLRRLDLVQRYLVPDEDRAQYEVGVREITLETYVADAPDDWEPTLNEEHTEHRWSASATAQELLFWPEARAAVGAAVVQKGGSADEVRTLLELINKREGASWSVVRQIPGGSQQGAHELRDREGVRAVLKWHTGHIPVGRLDQTARILEAARARGWPTPRWLGFGVLPAQSAYIIEEFIDGVSAAVIEDVLLDQLLAANRLQAGLEPETDADWSSYVHGVVFDDDPNGDIARLRGRTDTAAFAARLDGFARSARETALPTTDLVHGDFTPWNVLVRDGSPWLVDAAHAGKGTRAYDLAVLLIDSQSRLSAGAQHQILDEALSLVGGRGLRLCLAARMILLLEWGGRHWPADVPEAVRRCDALLEMVPD
jgi:8-oxo-dGTP pyrophosphatase MutT (NUDIX family)/aminoglycoside phosphotransferase (APT) family kinase protein